MATMEDAIREAYASNPVDTITYDTLEFIHPAFVDDFGNEVSVRVVQGFDDIEAGLEASAPLNPGETVKFTAVAFSFKKPGFDEDEVPSLQFSISNVSRLITKYLEEAIDDGRSITMIYRPYINTDLSGPQMDPVVTMELSSAEASLMAITGTATLETVHNYPFPDYQYTPALFPGLVR